MRFALVAVLVLTATPAFAHSWYSHKSDPVAGSCCSGVDCGMWAIEPGQITPEGEGYRVRMTRAQVLKANPQSDLPYIDQYFPESRVIDSEDGNWHACPKFAGSPSDGLRCLMRPPNG
jgi:hypothetical protein